MFAASFAALLSASGATIITTDTHVGVNDMTYEGQDLVVSNAVLTVDGWHKFNSLRVATGGVLTHSGPTNLATAGLRLTLVDDFELEPGASVNLNGRGYIGGSGPGQGGSAGNPASGGGGGGLFGGTGGASSGGGLGGRAFDGTLSTGSSGGSGVGGLGGAGGGLFYLSSTRGNCVINGLITANGVNATNSRAGGGAGGMIVISAQMISGAGVLSARGGAGEPVHGGGGGGGSIALYVRSPNLFNGQTLFHGGSGWQPGGAGTFLLVSNYISELVTVDNAGLAGATTPLDWMTQESSATVEVRGYAVAVSRTSLNFRNLILRSDSTLAAGAPTNNPPLSLVLNRDLTIEPGASITLDGRGYPPNQGPGLGASGSVGGGAGHGGYGGSGISSSGTVAAGGNAYDSITSPTQSGSGGRTVGNFPGGAGGGAVRLMVNGKLTLDGKISADATAGDGTSSGGGAGGSVWLTIGEFTGRGFISANGGAGGLPYGGGGAGGRIAVTYNSNAFTGKLMANGGNGAVPGGAGTIYLKTNSAQLPSLLVDNGGLIGTNTVLDVFSLANLTLRGGASLRPNSSSTISVGSLNVATNSTLLSPPNSTLNLSLSGPAVVEAGGHISANGQGPGSSVGVGAGGFSRDGGGGGGHGGFGGRGYSPLAGTGMGGNAHDNLANPTQAGGGGGGINSSGGSGGGIIRITANGPFTLDGRISANGLHSVSNSGGGGAGGTVVINVTQLPLLGSGTISADGGNGHLPGGGGGGGGRIAVSYPYITSGPQRGPTNGFLGSYSAKGGNGFMKGGAGTIFTRTNYNNVAQAFVDNGGVRGTNTLVAGTSVYDLTVMGGAVAVNLGFPRDVWVRSNAWLSTGQQLNTINIQRHLVIDAGGGVDLDGLGSSQSGGTSFSTPRAGGGHGGYGGFHFGNNGNTYGSATSPSQTGRPGGNGSGSINIGPFGGSGGGLAQMTVGSTLLLNGVISANGRDGEFNSGGGSGGGLLVQAATLSGSGGITATGGDGNGTAGGGGGGRIAIYYRTNLFTGTISACGGGGAQSGGAGTIYLRNDLSLVSSLLLNNCGLTGAGTPFSAFIGLATNMFVGGGTVAEAQGAIPIFSNLVVTSAGKITTRSANTELFLGLLGNLTVADDSAIVVDGKGFALTNGPGAGESLANQGAGGGHGGAGGASASEAIGGRTYGSPTRPMDRGSGGGAGLGPPTFGSEGGGVLRLAVAGTMAIDGAITANGASGVQDDAGGGAGGSIWISAGKLTGQGIIEAAGGDGELYGGGGGGGGRVAVYSPMNTFTGLVSVTGGNGAFVGETGTIFTSGSLGNLEVLSQTPSGIVSYVVTEILLGFSEPLDPASVTPDNVVLRTPQETLPPPNWTLSMPTPTTLRVSFGAQNVPGDYRVEVGPRLSSLFGTPMSQVYTGNFTVVLPAISGMVTDPNGQPVPGVRLYPDGSLLSAVTDATGHYSLSVPPNWSGAVKPALPGFLFVPGARSYTNLTQSIANEDYQMVAGFAPTLGADGRDSNLRLTWNAFAGVTYQLFASTNLVDWLPVAVPIAGTNGLMHLDLPVGKEPQKFFRLTAQN